jgi:tetratricopeptide (TPR) repeat protein
MAISGEIEKLEKRWHENPTGLTFAPLAEAHRKAGNPGRALEILDVGLTLHPEYVPAMVVRGRCHLDAEDYAAAESAFEQVLARDPTHQLALRGLAEGYEKLGQVGRAIEKLEFLLGLHRDDADARLQLERLRHLPPEAPVADEAFAPAPAPEPEFAPEPEPEVATEAERVVASHWESPPPPPPPPYDAESEPGDLSELMSVGDASPDAVVVPLHDMANDFAVQWAARSEAEASAAEAAPDPALEDLEPESATTEEPLAVEPTPVEPLVPAVAEAEVPPTPFEEHASPEEAPSDQELVITESMAELFLRQGHRELAAAVYRQLVERSPGDAALRAALAEVEGEGEAPTVAPARAYDARSTGGRSVEAILPAVIQAPPPMAQSEPVPPPAVSGEPTRAAAEPLSLGAVFGDEAMAPPAGAASESGPSESEPSYDEFFGARAAAEPPDGGEAEGQGEDLHQFNEWLRGLKR